MSMPIYDCNQCYENAKTLNSHYEYMQVVADAIVEGHVDEKIGNHYIDSLKIRIQNLYTENQRCIKNKF